jgi:Kef-type K+ transport system membrane component KefB
MLLAGIEMRPRDLAGVSGRAVPIAVVGMLLPFLFGLGLGWWWLPQSEWKLAQSLFIGVALAVTAVPAAVKVLLDLEQLKTRVGRTIIAAAVMDDVISLVLLAILTAIISTDQDFSSGRLAVIGVNVAIFFAIAWSSGRYLLPMIGGYVKRLDMEHAEFSLLIIYGLGLAVLAELLKMHFLIGAFAAGVFFNRNVAGATTYDRLRTQTEALTMGFLAPVFFASIGIHLNLGAVMAVPAFLILLLLAATIGKLAGAGIVARVSGFTNRQALAIGAAMNARGAVEIIIAGIALRAGLFNQPQPAPPIVEHLFSAIVIMAIVTTLVTPIALQNLLLEKDHD